ncbi:MAG: hypothetical protein O2819_02070 [Planctomycetota bacterium]|nr:hypothetical protein [Planctomycetota bacterium]MDA1105535.1 hypothetical protein [Planctomycetota bacterium]
MKAVLLGNFDGVHRGHQELVRVAREAVGPSGTVVALVLYPHPAVVLRRGIDPPLTRPEERVIRLAEYGADEVRVLEVTPQFLGVNPDDFLRALHQEEGFDFLVEGDGFRFGLERSGDLALARKIGSQLGFFVKEVSEITIFSDNTARVPCRSSTARAAVRRGDLDLARALLGRPFGVIERAEQGSGKARELGFPTANLHRRGFSLPPDGVYAGRGRMAGTQCWHPAAIHLGPRPTHPGLEASLEAVLLDDDALALGPPEVPPVGTYGWPLELEFFTRIREITQFSDLEALQEQIREDAASAVARFRAGGACVP